MSATPRDPPVTLFNVFVMQDAGTRGDRLGGSYDNISAVTIACAIYQSFQRFSPTPDRLVAVYDSTDTAVAFVGPVPLPVAGPV